MSEQSEDTPFVGAMKFLGGVAGFLWGGYIASEDPELNVFIGLLIGTLLGTAAGWIAGKTLEAVFQLAFIVMMLGIIALRILQVFGFIADFTA